MSKSGEEQFRGLLSDRRSRYIFLARLCALVVMTGAVGAYGLRGEARPVATPTPTSLLPVAVESPGRLDVTPTLTLLSSVTVDLSGNLDARGVLTDEVQIVSEDGQAILQLSRGTKVLDALGQPLVPASIGVTAREPPLLGEIALVGLAYEFGPEGVTLTPPASLAVHYDPDAHYPFSYQDVDCSRLHMAYFAKKRWVAPWLAASVDREANTVTAEIDHLGTFIIFCEVFQPPIS